MGGTDFIFIQFCQEEGKAGLDLFSGITCGAEMNILLQIALFHQCSLKKGYNFAGCNMFIHYLFKYAVFNSEKQYNGILAGQIILMDTVFVNQADVTFLKYNIFPGNFLFEVTFYNVSQFNVVMGVELRFYSVFKCKAEAEPIRCGIHGGTKLISSAEIPAQEENPLGRKQGICFDFFCGFGIFD